MAKDMVHAEGLGNGDSLVAAAVVNNERFDTVDAGDRSRQGAENGR
jgi:hypothetical protein